MVCPFVLSKRFLIQQAKPLCLQLASLTRSLVSSYLGSHKTGRWWDTSYKPRRYHGFLLPPSRVRATFYQSCTCPMSPVRGIRRSRRFCSRPMDACDLLFVPRRGWIPLRQACSLHPDLTCGFETSSSVPKRLLNSVLFALR